MSYRRHSVTLQHNSEIYYVLILLHAFHYAEAKLSSIVLGPACKVRVNKIGKLRCSSISQSTDTQEGVRAGKYYDYFLHNRTLSSQNHSLKSIPLRDPSFVKNNLIVKHGSKILHKYFQESNLEWPILLGNLVYASPSIFTQSTEGRRLHY